MGTFAFNMSRKKITEQDKLEILAALQENDWDVIKTANDFDLSPITIQRWVESHPNFKKAIRTTEKIMLDKLGTSTLGDVVEKKTRFLDKAFEAKEATVDQVRNVISECTIVKELAQMLKVLHEITDGGIQKSAPQNNNNFFQIVNNQINEAKQARGFNDENE